MSKRKRPAADQEPELKVSTPEHMLVRAVAEGLSEGQVAEAALLYVLGQPWPEVAKTLGLKAKSVEAWYAQIAQVSEAQQIWDRSVEMARNRLDTALDSAAARALDGLDKEGVDRSADVDGRRDARKALLTAWAKRRAQQGKVQVEHSFRIDDLINEMSENARAEQLRVQRQGLGGLS